MPHALTILDDNAKTRRLVIAVLLIQIFSLILLAATLGITSRTQPRRTDINVTLGSKTHNQTQDTAATPE